jgi:hypothetical protein
MFETAPLLPWLLWAAVTAIETRNETGAARAMLGTGLIAGLIVLAGHFQTALYSFLRWRCLSRYTTDYCCGERW